MAQLPTTSKQRLGVDIVNFDNNQRLYGIVMTPQGQRPLRVLVERAWLKTTYPDLLAELENAELRKRVKAAEDLKSRIESWMEVRKNDRLLKIFLEDELARIGDEAPQEDSSGKFVIAELGAARVHRVFRQPNDRKRIVGLAWEHDLPDVTTRSTIRLRKDLEAKNVDVERARFDLSSEIKLVGQTEQQWAAKVALVEFHLRKELEFQGTGKNLIRAGTKPDPAAMIGNLLGSSLDISALGRDLGLPEFRSNTPKKTEDLWWRRPTQEAEKDGFRGVLLTRLNQSALSNRISVESHFFAMESPGKWFEIYRGSATADANASDPDELNAIKEDPQIKAILDQIKGLGLGVDEATLAKALGHGAATQRALRKAKGDFYEFMRASVKRA